jgi:hypothetical protein
MSERCDGALERRDTWRSVLRASSVPAVVYGPWRSPSIEATFVFLGDSRPSAVIISTMWERAGTRLLPVGLIYAFACKTVLGFFEALQRGGVLTAHPTKLATNA